jgi:PKD repeat protein
LAAYHGADANTIEAFAKSTDSSTTSHTTPTATVTTDGSLAVSYWSDKGSTTGWTLPGSVTGRATQIGAGSAGWTSAALADSGSTVNSGSYGSKTATTNVSSTKGAMWTIILAPLGTTSTPVNAAFTSNCTNLHCTFDASTSTGNGLSYAWDFGDTANNTGTGVTTSHDYTTPGSHTVQLTVTDSNNVSNSVSHTVNPTSAPQNIGFVGSDAHDSSATSQTVTIPAGTAAGDTLLLFESHASTTITSSAPGAWTSIGNNNAGTAMHTTVWEKTAGAGDAGTTVTVNFSAAVKAEVTVAAYTHTAASPIESITGNTSGAGTNHTTPAASGLTAGTWVVSFWTDKSTTTTSWTPPGSVTKRKDIYGTSGGAVSALLADSNAGVSGSYPAQTATTNVSSGASSQWTIALSPSP